MQNRRTGELAVEETPPPALKPGGVLVRNAYSVISSGTERGKVATAKKSLIGKARERPEQFRKVMHSVRREGVINTYRKVMTRLEEPTPLGYSSAGIVVEVGERVDGFRIGDRVACGGGGYANHAQVVSVPRSLCVKVPEPVSLEHAAFTTLGAVALQGVRQAEVRLGEKVAVIGLGLIGLLTIQILRAAGCEVLAIDVEPERVELARELGAELAAVRGAEDIGRLVDRFTHGYGVDGVIITAGTRSNDPLILAGEMARDRGRVVLVGTTKLQFPRERYYEKELSLVLSRSYGPGRYDPNYEERALDYPIGYVRWTERRNMEAFIRLLSSKRVGLARLITHRFKIEDGREAYKVLTGEEPSIAIVLEYEGAQGLEKSGLQTPRPGPSTRRERAVVGLIGAGSFAQSYLLPSLRGLPVSLKGVATSTGLTAKWVAQRYGFSFCTSDYADILDDEEINTVFIATRHDLHSKLVIEALSRGKNVFCEKPLCLREKELAQVVQVVQSASGRLMVGFNRRFAPLVGRLKSLMDGPNGPYVINYRVNAGPLPLDHWVRDPEQGGGRVVGETCHFVDLIQFLVSEKPTRVYAEQADSRSINIPGKDNVEIVLSFANGSIGNISYVALGDSEFPKERIEVFGGGKVGVIDDFRETVFWFEGRRRRLRSLRVDKGHRKEFQMFLHALAKGEPAPIPFEEIVSATLATFRILESLRKGVPVEI